MKKGDLPKQNVSLPEKQSAMNPETSPFSHGVSPAPYVPYAFPMISAYRLPYGSPGGAPRGCRASSPCALRPPMGDTTEASRAKASLPVKTHHEK